MRCVVIEMLDDRRRKESPSADTSFTSSDALEPRLAGGDDCAMTRPRSLSLALLVLAVSIASPLLAATNLVPVLTGLLNPVFVAHAGDGSKRLFVVEQDGTIRVWHAGAAATSLFLDVRDRVLSGGERGLLGLAFHPLYRVNGRFFVYYTRNPDGTIVIAEYHVTSDRDVASRDERVLLTIPHPVNANHNGGMLTFGPGGYLFIGVGDGGSANDPPNNAQNVEMLLGKILRLDVDRSDTAAGTPYSAPASNPFVGRAGRDEIFAFGFRNPWRFSFDRRTNQQWVGDVGQDRFEEVDTPILEGGNYGWRVYEGLTCSNNDASLCGPGRYINPIFDYPHTAGRCSITGGYVYRGPAGALDDGTYVYADYCSGEIFAWDGRDQRLLLQSGSLISSFGEDEDGELYVVALGGTVSKIVTDCQLTLSAPGTTIGVRGETGVVSFTSPSDCAWTATSHSSWITIDSTASGAGSGTVVYTVAPYKGHVVARIGTITIGDATYSIRQSR
jgi:glucose/arabinose dehydrogenase